MAFQGLSNLFNSIQSGLNSYSQQVADNKQNLPSPFFNDTGNNPIQWAGKVVQDVKQRGPFEGLQDLTNPIIQQPQIYPYAEPLISGARTANYKAGRPNLLLNALLGQVHQNGYPMTTDELNFNTMQGNVQQGLVNPIQNRLSNIYNLIYKR